MTIHVVGAGLAGLAAACAVARAGAGHRIRLYEAAPGAGGRCRSWHDRHLDTEIDNGTHVVLGANRAVKGFLAALGAEDGLAWLRHGPTITPSDGSIGWAADGPRALIGAWRRFGGPALAELTTALALAAPHGPATIGARFGRRSRLASEFWDPLARAVMNTSSAQADAAAFARVLRATLLRGPAAMRVAVARRSLAGCFVDPALASLRAAGADLRLRARLRAIERSADRPARLLFDESQVDLPPGDRLILALPPWDLAALLPDSAPAWTPSPIVNLHVRLDLPAGPADAPDLIGLAGRRADWILRRGPVVSVTTSAADALVDGDPEAVARALWADSATALGLAHLPLPPRWRVVKEKRATPRQTPDFAAARRRLADTGADGGGNAVILAGDWTLPSLPCTIETALLSGETAATRALGRRV